MCQLATVNLSVPNKGVHDVCFYSIEKKDCPPYGWYAGKTCGREPHSKYTEFVVSIHGHVVGSAIMQAQ